MTPIAPHMEAFLRERLPVERGASINTCDSYAYAFRLLLQYASECLKVRPSELNLEQLDAPLILKFLKYLETTRRNGQNSRNTRLAAIKSFMHFVEYRVPSALEQIRCVLAIPAKKTDTRLVRHLSVEELQSIIDAPSPSKPDGIRDRAMLHLCFAAALRVSELVGLRRQRRGLTTTGQRVDSRQRSAAAMPATVEGNDRSIEGLAGAQTLDNVRARAVPQCPRSGDDARRLRVHSSQARQDSEKPLSLAGSKTSVPTCAASHRSARNTASHKGPAQSVAVARACPHAND